MRITNQFLKGNVLISIFQLAHTYKLKMYAYAFDRKDSEQNVGTEFWKSLK